MTISVFAYGIGLFFAALTMHVTSWNLFRIKKEALWLVIIFMFIPSVILVSLWAADHLQTPLATAAGMLHMVLAVVYIQTYPALREDIPSIRILVLLHKHPEGLSREQILQLLAQQQLFETKIADLENDAFVHIRGEKINLTTAGAILSAVFNLYRKLLGSEAGKG